MKNILKMFYIECVKINYFFRKLLFNVEYANKLFFKMERSAVIPMVRFAGGKVGENCFIESPVTFHNAVSDLQNFEIGDNTIISRDCLFDLTDRIIIGDKCSLAMQVMVATHTHYGNCCFGQRYRNVNSSVKIGNNTYVGARATLINGVVVGGDSVIAAGSLINKDVGKGSLVAGVPGKVIKELS